MAIAQFDLMTFLLVLSRMSGLFISAPVLSSRQLPRMIKTVAAIGISGFMSLFVQAGDPAVLTSSGLFILAVIMEVFVGYVIGFVAFVLFAAIQLAGQFMDMGIGFGMVNVIDPQSGIQVPITGNFVYLLALVVYLNLNGHHHLFQAIVTSYQTIPVLGLQLSGSMVQLFMNITASMFLIAVQFAAPIIIALLITDLGMGFIARTVPQMNIFIVGLSLKILV